MIAEKIIRQTTELKTLVAAGLEGREAERGIHACNAILAEAERVAGLEQVVIRPEQGHD
jgi:hypothetical protein